MVNPGLPETLWAVLRWRVWHATDIQGLAGILAHGFIRVSQSERYTSSFCRRADCVSLFDFGPGASDQSEADFSNWSGWFGYQQASACAIWLQIDRNRIADSLMDPEAVRAAWRQSRGDTLFFRGVEACHQGPVRADTIEGAVFVDTHDRSRFEESNKVGGALLDAANTFIRSLPPPPQEHSLIPAVRRRREAN
jgi:hypothetical protein